MAESIYSITDGIDIDYDITRPPGVAGAIVNDINRQAFRDQKRLSVLSALQILSCVSAPSLRTPFGSKGSLYTVGIAPTASGKDIGMKYTKKALKSIGIPVYQKIPSAKSINKVLIDSDGVAVYVLDEVHEFFDALDNSRSPAYLKEIGGSMLNLYTDDDRSFDILEKREAKKEAQEAKKAIEKECRDTGIVLGSGEHKRRIEEVDLTLNKILNGINMPFFAMSGYSTPDNMRQLFSAKNFESGLSGRLLIVVGDEEVSRMEFRINRDSVKVDERISQHLSALKNKRFGKAQFFDQQAIDAAKDCHDRFELHVNDQDIGSIARRSAELLSRVYTVLSVGDGGKIKREHVYWSFMFVCESFLDVWLRYRANVNEADNSYDARWAEIKDKISIKLKGSTVPKPVYKSKIVEALFRSKKSKLNTLVKNAFPTDFESGKAMIINIALAELMMNGAVNVEGGSKVSVMDAKKFPSTQAPRKFIDIYNSVAMQFRPRG